MTASPCAARELARLLTDREREVLAAMATGQSNTAIAASLVISRKAVEKHVNSIFAKMLPPDRQALDPRVQAVLIYLEVLAMRPSLARSDDIPRPRFVYPSLLARPRRRGYAHPDSGYRPARIICTA